MVSKKTRFNCQPDMMSSWFICHGALRAIFLDGFWKSNHNFLIVIYSNFLSAMHNFRDNEVLLQAGYESLWFFRQGSLHAILHDKCWKSDHYFLIAFHSNCWSTMHGFRDNEVLLQAGYDVIVSPPLGGAVRTFSWRILKERPWLPDSVP